MLYRRLVCSLWITFLCSGKGTRTPQKQRNFLFITVQIEQPNHVSKETWQKEKQEKGLKNRAIVHKIPLL
jgi:hypothetical protein